jgi:isoleucyl-tRNA synthetase
MFQPVEKRFDLIKFEHEMLTLWDETQAFDKLRKKNEGNATWSFLDGPITANNPMGVHHAWGRTLKDCYQRFHAMKGYDQRYQNGFDCQGLWVEVEVEKEMGFGCKRDIEAYGLEKFINACKDRVRKFSDVQTEQSKRLGYWMDWDNSYFTMDDENNYTIWAFLKKCHERGLIKKGRDAMPWCARCGTGISEQERREGYKVIKDTAVFIKLKLRDKENESLLVWTTTPWTLAANVACAVHPEMKYIKVEQNGEYLIVLKELVKVVKEKGPYEIIEEFPGSHLLGLQYIGPFDDMEAPGEIAKSHHIIPWKEITATEGTGIVHIAPGCGKEDFELSKELELPVLSPINESGVYFEGYGFLTGQRAHDVADQVLDELRKGGVYYKKETYSHDYPHCWRCKDKLLFRCTDEWYIGMSWREEIMEIVQKIRWIPGYGKDLELDWLSNMGDWMISKKRYWGLALPIFQCECGWFDVIGGKEELKERAVEGWDDFDGNSPHRPWVDNIRIKCAKCGEKVGRIPDVGNPWLDAGIVPYSTVNYSTDKDYWQKWMPADLVLECFPGQFRNWFYALLSMSTMMENTIPFKTLLGHALVRDEHGEEMHKSSGNAIWFDDAAEKMGVEAMRWLYCRQNPVHNLNFGYGLTDTVKRRVFNTWWNVHSFFINYARTDNFDPSQPKIPVSERQDLDRWILSRLQELIQAGNECLADYDAPGLLRKAEEFFDALSTFYVRRSRRRFWRPTDPQDMDKLAAYQTLHEVLVALTKILAPIVPMLTEKFYQALVRDVDTSAPESVHHCDYPEFDAALHDEELAREMDAVLRIISAALSIREQRKLRVRLPLSELTVMPSSALEGQAVRRFGDHITDELNIKTITVSEEAGELVRFEIKPNFRLLGPKFGKRMGIIGKALAQEDVAEVAAKVRKGEAVSLQVDGEQIELAAEEIQVEQHAPDNLAVAEDHGLIVALNVEITPDLEREGLARDVVRHIQQMRKELDLDLIDHIAVAWHTDDALLAEAVREHAATIQAETLCDALVADSSGEGKEVALSGKAIKLNVAKS